MSDQVTSTPSARSWRDIPQEITPRAMSQVGRRRLTVRTARNLLIATTGVIVVVGGLMLWRALRQNPHRLAAVASSQPVEHIVVETDGVLSREWVEQTLDLRKDIGLMELDLYALRAKLLANRQVKSAVLKRQYPSTLLVTLEERSPVVRLKARAVGPELQDFLVAQDGTVYPGTGYEAEIVDRLPWLGGVRLVQLENGFEPLVGMARVADLLATARGNVPDVFDTWRVVSLERLSRDGNILIQSSTVPEIVFGTREDFYTQIARLDYILDETRRRSAPPVRSINLAVGAAQVPVALSLPVTAGTSSGAPSVRFTIPNR